MQRMEDREKWVCEFEAKVETFFLQLSWVELWRLSESEMKAMLKSNLTNFFGSNPKFFISYFFDNCFLLLLHVNAIMFLLKAWLHFWSSHFDQFAKMVLPLSNRTKPSLNYHIFAVLVLPPIFNSRNAKKWQF